MHFRCLTSALLLCTLCGAAQAAFITVNSADFEFNNDGDCSILEAVGSANDNTGYDQCVAGSAIGSDTIFISVNGTITMSGNLSITERVEIFGLGENATILDGDNLTLHFLVNMPDATHDFDLANVTLRNGTDTVPGGSVWVQQSGDLRFENIRFESNQGTLGGAIATTFSIDNEVDVEIIDVEFIGNTSTGNGGAATFPGFPTYQPPRNVRIERSLFELNQAAGSGGALFFDDVGGAQIETSIFRDNETINGGGSSESGGAIHWAGFAGLNNLLSIRRSTFEDNIAWSDGGAISQVNGIMSIENSTLVGNRARSANGAAIIVRSDALAAVFSSTLVDHDIANNAIDSTITISNDASLALDHTVIWNPNGNGGNDCEVNHASASLNSNGFNFDTDGTCTSHATDQSGVDPLLWQLGDYGDGVNGRVIETFLPRPDSPLVDGGKAGPCTGAFGGVLSTDARGVTRPLNGDGLGGAQCDPGAVEFDVNNDPVGHALNVTVVGNTGGSVTSKPEGIDCPGDCGEFFIDDSLVQLTANADPGFEFDGWSGDCSGSGNCEVLMDGKRNVAATFSPSGVELAVTLAGPGTGAVISQPAGIDCPGICSFNFPPSTSVDLSAIAGTESSFQNWAGACTGAGSCSLILNEDTIVNAIFLDNEALFIDSFE
ncbi:MAG: choice-of-anchor Q domain-containing protein [Pseudomonadota bacterium]